MTKEKIAVVERIKMHISHYFFLCLFSLDTLDTHMHGINEGPNALQKAAVK